MSFAENLQYLRKRDRITQEELADDLQVTRQSVSKWETGEAYPETEKLIALCDKFGVTLDELVRGDVAKGAATDGGEKNGACADGGKGCACADDEESAQTTVNGENSARPLDKKEKLMHALGSSFGGFIMTACLVAYLCMGFVQNLWHPGWLVFPGGMTLCIILGSIFGNDGGHDCDEHKRDDYEPNFKERLFGGFAGASMMAAVTVYLCLGFLCNLWHPGWICFIVGGALSSVFGGLAHYFSDKRSA